MPAPSSDDQENTSGWIRPPPPIFFFPSGIVREASLFRKSTPPLPVTPSRCDPLCIDRQRQITPLFFPPPSVAHKGVRLAISCPLPFFSNLSIILSFTVEPLFPMLFSPMTRLEMTTPSSSPSFFSSVGSFSLLDLSLAGYRQSEVIALPAFPLFAFFFLKKCGLGASFPFSLGAC